jgi:lipopolysaccharide heptosyltransferase II
MPQHDIPRRILAVKLADLGDMLTITPALQALRAAHPAAHIDLLVPPSSAALLEGVPFLDGIVAFDKFPFDTPRSLLSAEKIGASLGFIAQLRAARYDTLVFFHHFATRWGALKFALVAYASGAPLRVGLDNGRAPFLTLRTEDRGFGAMHEVDYWLEVAALLGAEPDAGWRPYLPVTEGDRLRASGLLNELPGRSRGPLVAVHPGAGAYSPARIWPIEHFGAVARILLREGANIVILGGPDERERGARLAELSGSPDRVLDLTGRTSIHETGAVLEACDLFLGNDSGPMHIAAAMHTPVTAVFGPSNAAAWGPYTPRGEWSPHTVISLGLPCQPCFYRGRDLGLREGCGPKPCLKRLSPERVAAACRETLRRGERVGAVSGVTSGGRR